MARPTTVRYIPEWHLHQGHIEPDRKRVGLGAEAAREFRKAYEAQERAMAQDAARQPCKPVIRRRAPKAATGVKDAS